MRTIRALLVAIDGYRAPVTPLSGCNNDIDRVAAFLGSRVEPGTAFAPLILRDADATRAAVIDAFEGHLGAAGPHDTALFWFSGHGSDAPCPPQLRHLEPSGRMQTLLCHDSRHGGVPELLDKELALLVEGVAAGGAHVAVVLDCCHSGGGTRDETPGRSGARGVDGATVPPDVAVLLPRLRRMIEDGSAATLRPARTSHVALSACQPHQRANELPPLQGRRYGVFSTALLNAVHRLGPSATYRDLIAAASCDVETLYPDQRPMLDPGEPGLADQPFLGGGIRPAASAMTLRYTARQWQVDVGACHGLPAAGPAEGDPDGTGERTGQGAVEVDRTGTGDREGAGEVDRESTRTGEDDRNGSGSGTGDREGAGAGEVDRNAEDDGTRTSDHADADADADAGGDGGGGDGVVRFAVPGSDPPRTARVVRTLTRHCVVELDGWDDPAVRRRTHPVVLAEIPLPRVTVAVEPAPGAGPAAAALLHAIASAAPHGGPSPHVREAAPGEPAELRVVLDRDGAAGILGPDGARLTAARPAGQGASLAVVRDLEHIARWRRVRSLRNPASGLGAAVRLECYPAGRDEDRRPPGRDPVRAGADGAVRLRYRRGPDGGWEAPALFLRLRNTTGRRLHCAVLDLTDRFAADPVLFPGWWVEDDADVADGAPVEFAVPAGRPVQPGAVARDWLLLLVSATDFSSAPFTLPALGEPDPGPARAATGLGHVLDRLGSLATQRTASVRRPVAADWSTTVVPVVTEVPTSG